MIKMRDGYAIVWAEAFNHIEQHDFGNKKLNDKVKPRVLELIRNKIYKYTDAVDHLDFEGDFVAPQEGD